ncbi:MAG TPA: oligopeptidase A, partial [Burkholderiaceae bacterium]|nr:oligopeptidase A [Burkholderiaceae bacterium]
MNALLARSGLPRYDGLDPKALGPEIDELIAAAQSVLEAVVAPDTPATWDAVMAPLTTATEALGRTWSAVHHMGGVMDSPEWRDLTNSKLEVVTAFWSSLAQDRRLFEKMKALASAADVLADPARQQAISNSLRDFRLGGAELSTDQQRTFAEQTARLAQLSQTFSEQLLDSTNASFVHVTDSAELDGIPEHALAAAREEAKQRGLEGHVFTLQQPSLLPVLQFAKHRRLR